MHSPVCNILMSGVVLSCHRSPLLVQFFDRAAMCSVLTTYIQAEVAATGGVWGVPNSLKHMLVSPHVSPGSSLPHALTGAEASRQSSSSTPRGQREAWASRAPFPKDAVFTGFCDTSTSSQPNPANCPSQLPANSFKSRESVTWGLPQCMGAQVLSLPSPVAAAPFPNCCYAAQAATPNTSSKRIETGSVPNLPALLTERIYYFHLPAEVKGPVAASLPNDTSPVGQDSAISRWGGPAAAWAARITATTSHSNSVAVSEGDGSGNPGVATPHVAGAMDPNTVSSITQ
jgi:hypothetical protein